MKSVFLRSGFTKVTFTALLSIFFVSCSSMPKPFPSCPTLPDEISGSDLVGVWSAREYIGEEITDTLIIREDGKYKQLIDMVIEDEKPIHVETEWQGWTFEVNNAGIGYLHLVGLDVCTRLGETACEYYSYSDFHSDYCMGNAMEASPGEQVLIVAGIPNYDVNVPTPVREKQFTLSLSMGFENSPWQYDYEGPVR